jgi:NitT/TauT family transport system ATP-binding protein
MSANIQQHNAEAIYSCRNLSIEFGQGAARRRVLDSISFDVHRGEFLALLGTSGVGKTTLLRILGGLLEAAPGSEIQFEGEPVDGPPEKAVVVFQDYAGSLLRWRTVAKNVALGIERALSKAEVAERTERVLKLVGLEGRGNDYPWQLSGGMQQRVQLARALAMEPAVLLMDEPFGALDAMTRAGLQDELLSIQRETGTTIVFITHDIEEAIYLSSRVIVLSGSPGRVVFEDTVDLPRPRDQVSTRENSEYLRLRHEVYAAVGHKVDLATRGA